LWQPYTDLPETVGFEVLTDVATMGLSSVRYNAVQSIESQLSFRRNMSLSSSGLKNKPSKRPCHINYDFYGTECEHNRRLLRNQFRAHDLCDCDYRRHTGAQFEAVLATVGEDIHVNFRLYEVSKEIQSLKLGKTCSFDDIPN
jgi:hypothetical protein